MPCSHERKKKKFHTSMFAIEDQWKIIHLWWKWLVLWHQVSNLDIRSKVRRRDGIQHSTVQLSPFSWFIILCISVGITNYLKVIFIVIWLIIGRFSSSVAIQFSANLIIYGRIGYWSNEKAVESLIFMKHYLVFLFRCLG